MAREFITEKQVGREFWYFAVCHAAMMINQVPGQLGLKLTTLFELVHNSKPDSKTWFKLFSIGYFNHDTDNYESRSKNQAHTLVENKEFPHSYKKDKLPTSIQTNAVICRKMRRIIWIAF